MELTIQCERMYKIKLSKMSLFKIILKKVHEYNLYLLLRGETT